VRYPQVANRVGHSLGAQDLVRARIGGDARREVHRRPKEIAFLSRLALLMTVTLLKDMASAASRGERRKIP